MSMDRGIVRVEFKTDNAAFDDYRTLEIADILKGIAENIENNYRIEGVIRDVNGARIGTWTTEGTNE